jgi:hypothetical protein
MEPKMRDPNQGSDTSETTKRGDEKLRAAWRARYEGSFAQGLVRGLGGVDFGDRIIIFGACLLLSVLPLIIVLSAYAGHRIQDDIARHLGLSEPFLTLCNSSRFRSDRIGRVLAGGCW